jgi:NAD+ kinase
MTQCKKPRARRQPKRFRNALVVWKKTYLMEVTEQNDTHSLELIAANHPSMAKVKRTHQEHMDTVAAVQNELARHRIKYTLVQRDQMEAELSKGKYDLVVTVGGDGTTLDASHYLGDNIPVLGVNSALSSSHGHYCVASIENIAVILDEVMARKRDPISVMRLQLTLDGKRLPEPVVNELLISHCDIGATSRYLVTIDGFTEEHKSDGMFFGTPSGSTGWMRSYGADVLPVDSRYLQYLTRGLIVPPGKRLRFVAGMLPNGAKIKVISQMPQGKLFVDGRHIQYDFPRGAELEISVAPSDLRLFIDKNVNLRYHASQPQRREPPRH